MHKLLNVGFVNPGCTQPHIDFGCVQVLGLYLAQSLHVGTVQVAHRRRLFGVPQLLTDISGQVFICGHILGLSMGEVRNPENDTFQLLCQVVLGFAGELLHVSHVHTGPFGNGYGQSVAGGIHGQHRLMGLNGSPGEHIRFTLQLAVLVDNLQGAQEVIGRIIRKGQPVCPAVNQAVLRGKRIIKLIQGRLLRLNLGSCGAAVQLKGNQLPDAIPQANHAFYPCFCRGVQTGPHHPAVLPEVHRSVYQSIGVISHIGVGRDGGVRGFASPQLRQFGLLISAVDVLYGLLEQHLKFRSLYGTYGVVHAVGGAFRFLAAQNHPRMVDKIAVNDKPIFRSSGLGPVRHHIQGTVPLLQENDVGNNLGSGVGLKRIVGQPDGSQKLSPLGQVPAHGGILGVHGKPAGDKGHHATGSYLVQSFGEKVVVDVEVQLVVGAVVDLVLPEGHIAHGQVEEVSPVCGFKPGYGDVRLGIKLPGDPAGNAVQLHTIQLTASHFLREHTKEVTHTAGRLQDVAGFKAHVAHGLIDSTDNCGAGVMGIQRGGSGCGVFLGGKQLLQLGVLGRPGGLLRVESVCQTAPSHIPGEGFLLLRHCLLSCFLQVFQQLDCLNVGLELGFGAAFTQVFVGDVEILGVAAQVIFVFLVGSFLCGLGIWEGLPFTINLNGYRVFLVGIARKRKSRGCLCILCFDGFNLLLFRGKQIYG